MANKKKSQPITEADVKLAEAKAKFRLELLRSAERGVVFGVVAGLIIWQMDDEMAKNLLPILTYFLGVVTNYCFRSR